MSTSPGLRSFIYNKLFNPTFHMVSPLILVSLNLIAVGVIIWVQTNYCIRKLKVGDLKTQETIQKSFQKHMRRFSQML